MKNSDVYQEEARGRHREFLKTLHRQQAVEREEADLAGLKPLLPSDVEAAWATLERGV